MITQPPRTRRTRAILAAYEGSALPRPRSQALRVAVIGAGLAGLAAAHLLRRAGLWPAVFEASPRVGGRTRTDRTQEAGLVSEHGGEFIDSQHHDIMALATLLKLDLIDTGTPDEAKLATAYHFGGMHRSQDEVVAAYADVAPRIARDVASLSRRVSRRRHTRTDERFDRLSVAEYLAGLDMAPWLRQLIEVAFVTVYGGDAGEQSSINLLSLIGTDLSHGMELFGHSDERYKIRDGADRIAAGLAQGLDGRVYTGHRLLRLSARGKGYRLALQTPSSKVVEVDADAVVLALPFTLLRQVELRCDLPAFKRKAIDQLGYGDNAKLLIGVQQRFWREQGESGSLYSDMPLQCAWDSSRLRAGERAILTCFLGGREGRALGAGSAQAHGRRLAAQAERIYPGFEARLTGSVERVHWPSEPFALGSYTCYRTGQWTTIAGDEATPVGNLYFAGEHCATASQGYMNGAAETGRQAALQILERLA